MITHKCLPCVQNIHWSNAGSFIRGGGNVWILLIAWFDIIDLACLRAFHISIDLFQWILKLSISFSVWNNAVWMLLCVGYFMIYSLTVWHSLIVSVERRRVKSEYCRRLEDGNHCFVSVSTYRKKSMIVGERPKGVQMLLTVYLIILDKGPLK